jgi:methyl-accepting chemotaxis protein
MEELYMKLTIRKKLFLAFGTILLLMLFLASLGLYEIKGINHNVEDIYDQSTALNYIKDAEFNISKVQRAEKNVLLASTIDEKKEHVMHLDEAYDDGIIKNLREYKKLPHASDKDKIDSLIENINKVRKQQTDIINKSMNGKNEEAITLSSENTNIFQDIETEIDSIGKNNMLQSEQQHNNSMEIYDNVIKLVIVFSAVILAVSIILTLILSSSIMKPLQKSISFAKNIADGNLTDNLNLKLNDELGILINALNDTSIKLKEIVSKIKFTSTEVNLGSSQLASAMENANKTTSDIGQKITNVTETIQHIADSVEYINISLKIISTSSSKVSTLSENVKNNSLAFREHAHKSKEAVDITVSTMNSIGNATMEVKTTISALNVLSNKISDITSMISNIANQTNMLALNAAIEAARAGEHGKGFSVVADQVKKLAEESASAASSIEQMILDIKAKTNIAVKNILFTENKVDEGISVANNTESQINLILENMNTLVSSIEEISIQTQNQALSTNSISQNMDSIVENTQTLSNSSQDINSNIEEQIAVIQEITSTSETLSSMTENLNSMVEYFKVRN